MHMHTFVTCFKHRTSVSMAAYPARPLQLILTLNSLTDDPGLAQIRGQWLADMSLEGRCMSGIPHPSHTEGYSHRTLNYPLALLSGSAATVLRDTVWRQVLVQRLLLSGFPTQRLCISPSDVTEMRLNIDGEKSTSSYLSLTVRVDRTSAQSLEALSCTPCHKAMYGRQHLTVATAAAAPRTQITSCFQFWTEFD